MSRLSCWPPSSGCGVGSGSWRLFECVEQEVRHQLPPEVLGAQAPGQEAESRDPTATRASAAVAPHPVSVVVPDRRGVVNDDLFAGVHVPRSEKEQSVVPLSDPGVRCARVVEPATKPVAGVEVRFVAKAETVREECPATSHEHPPVVHWSADAADRPPLSKCPRRDEAEPGACRLHRNTADDWGRARAHDGTNASPAAATPRGSSVHWPGLTRAKCGAAD